MRNCQNCGLAIPRKVKINGKEHNLQRRKYCLVCSPFGLHNTTKLNAKLDRSKSKFCKTCGKIFHNKGSRCWSCTSKKSRERHAKTLFELMGGKCWICGYNKCRGAMDYHHVNPTEKLFELTMREMQYAWHRILKEAKKCVLLCSRCHREYHCGLINNDVILDLHKSIWCNIGPVA